MAHHYDRQFYEAFEKPGDHSPQQITSFLLPILRPRSVVDVGCAEGFWLAQFRAEGIEDVLGIDGAYVNPKRLKIPGECFRPMDLEQPIRLGRTFDLAVSVEVAEHLSPPRAQSFVEDLTRLAPCVLFSAAIPGQGGVHHVNERWQSYWSELFQEHGYQTVDCVRSRFWNDPTIYYWYRQNMFLYVHEGLAAQLSSLSQSGPLDIVHPEKFAEAAHHPSLGFVLSLLPGAVLRSLRQRLFGTGWRGIATTQTRGDRITRN